MTTTLERVKGNTHIQNKPSILIKCGAESDQHLISPYNIMWWQTGDFLLTFYFNNKAVNEQDVILPLNSKHCRGLKSWLELFKICSA